MQLQAERDQFVHSGIGGGSSSSSTSPCSPSKNKPHPFLTLANLKRPRPSKATGVGAKANINTTTEATPAAAAPSTTTTTTATTTAATVTAPETTCQNALSIDGAVMAATTLPALVATTEVFMDICPSSSQQPQQEPLSQQQPEAEAQVHAETTFMEDVIPSTPAAKASIVEHLHPSYTNINTLPSSADNIEATSAFIKDHPTRDPARTCPGEITRLWDATKVHLNIPPSAPAPTQHYPTEPQPVQTPAPYSYPPEPSSCAFTLERNFTTSQSSPPGMDRLSSLPSELLFHILCHLDALDLTRVAQTGKFYYRISSDSAIWRFKSTQHSLYSPAHLQGRQSPIPWHAYYQYLHRNSLRIKQNWADAVPQSVHVLEGHTGLVSSLEMSIWSLVTASIDSTLRVWDLRTLECKQVLRSTQSLTCVSQSEKARAVCARTSFGALCIWDTTTGELVLQDDHAMPQIASFIYMDENYIGYGQCDGVVTVFDWSSRTQLDVVGTYQAHEGDVIHISILDRKYVVSASTNGETLVYSLTRRCIIERILLPHATQAIQFTPTIHGDKVMFSTRDAVYEYELQLGYLTSAAEREPTFASSDTNTIRNSLYSNNQGRYGGNYDSNMMLSSAHQPRWSNHARSGLSSGSRANADRSQGNSISHRHLQPPSPNSMRSGSTSGRVWKTSNSLLSQIRQRVGGTEKAFDMERMIIPTRFPRLASLYCLPRTYRSLDHGTTSARDSYGVFLPNHCTRLDEISVYTRATKRVKQIHGPAVEAVLSSALRNRFYTTMECNEHCAVVSSGNKVYVISFLPPDL
ncbi:hypothetical protein EC991_005213 [Linnemannia zychae]|nr:hypothetical protein EC991_005213 [Linnemannia zychae]